MSTVDFDLPDECGLDCSLDRDILTIEFDQPERRNPQTPATWEALITIGESVPAGVVAIVLSGRGSSFSAGLDRRLFTPEGIPGQPSLIALAGLPVAHTDAAIARWQRAFTIWRDLPQLTIALVQGHAIGAGFQLALGADLMIVAHDVEMAMREAKLGLVPDLGGTAQLLEAVGYRRALELCVTGRAVTAAEAVQWGLAAAAVAPDALREAANPYIDAVRTSPLGAGSAVKQLLAGGIGLDRTSQLASERAAQIERLRVLSRAMGGS